MTRTIKMMLLGGGGVAVAALGVVMVVALSRGCRSDSPEEATAPQTPAASDEAEEIKELKELRETVEKLQAQLVATKPQAEPTGNGTITAGPGSAVDQVREYWRNRVKEAQEEGQRKIAEAKKAKLKQKAVAEEARKKQATIADLQDKIQDRKEGREICLRVARETTDDSVRRQAQRDLRTVESEIARLEKQLSEISK